METDPRTFKAPFIDKAQCWHAADKFREQYWPSGAIPVEVLEIAEFDLDLEIRTITGLREECDVDALLLGDWKTLEYHANEFAGRFLVPIVELDREFERVLQDVERNGLTRHQLTDGHLSYLCTPLAKYFAVSAEVIEKRLTRENLWPL